VTNREILDNNMRFIYIFENVYICVLPVQAQTHTHTKSYLKTNY